ncbi:PREDICTED: chromodomain-helicase-DNA-binding protein 8-like [Calidris pugnax]|uniref:chromodomain-helicase-DNA-binding protein 8-like n=1 Tax=Calidris pugnax TaxID=198806 RepID=UPI00071D6F78|nr:PREDICTED: chromodomain-helicase-DNA-binding protein 8-like [Calidris pugnax]
MGCLWGLLWPHFGVPHPKKTFKSPPNSSPHSEIDIWFPLVEQLEVPTSWWDAEADKSLLIGVFKHGYERYNTMRADPALCFLEKAGRPDEKAIAAEQRLDGGDG